MPLTEQAKERKRQEDRKKEEQKKREERRQSSQVNRTYMNRHPKNSHPYVTKMTEAKKSAQTIKNTVANDSPSLTSNKLSNRNTNKFTPKNAYTDTGTRGRYLPSFKEKRTYSVGGQGAEKGRGLTAEETNQLSGVVRNGINALYNRTNESTNTHADTYGAMRENRNIKQSGTRSQASVDKSNQNLVNNDRHIAYTDPALMEHGAYVQATNPFAKALSNIPDAMLDNSYAGMAYSLANDGEKLSESSFWGTPINQDYEQARKSGLSATIGQFAGTGMSYGLKSNQIMGNAQKGYTKFGKDVIDAVSNTRLGRSIANSSVLGKIGQATNRSLEELATDRIRDVASNIAVGMPFNLATDVAQGYRGSDLAKQFAFDTAADFGFDTAGNVAGDIFGKIGKELKIAGLNNSDITSGLDRAKNKQEYVDTLLKKANKIIKDKDTNVDVRVRDASVNSATKYLDEIRKVETMTDTQFERYKQGLTPNSSYNATRGPKNQPRISAKTENSTIRSSNDTYTTPIKEETPSVREPDFNGDLASKSEIREAIDAIQLQRLNSGVSIIDDMDELTNEVIQYTGKDAFIDDVTRTYREMTDISPEQNTQTRTKLKDELQGNQQNPRAIDRLNDPERAEADAKSETQKTAKDYDEVNKEEEPIDIPFSELDENTKGINEYESEASFAESVRNRELSKRKKAKKELTKAEEPNRVETEAKTDNVSASADSTIKIPKRATNETLNGIAKENSIYVPQNVTIRAESGKGGADKARRKPATKAQIQEAIEGNYKEAEADLNLMEYQKILNDSESSADDILNKYIAERSTAGSPIGDNELSVLKELDKDGLYNAIESRTLKINGVKTFDDLADLLTIEKRGWAGEISQNKATKVDGSNKKRGGVTASDVATVKMGNSISVPTGDLVADIGNINDLKAGDYLVHNKHGVAQFEGFVKDKSIAEAFGLDKNTNFLKIKLGGDNNSITIRPDQANKLLKRYVGEDTPELGKMFDSSDVAHSMNAGVEDELTKTRFDKNGTETSSNDVHIGNESNTRKLPRKLDKGKARQQWENWVERQPDYLKQKTSQTASAEGQPLPQKGEAKATGNTGELPKGEKPNGAAKYNNKTNYTSEQIAKMHGKSKVEYDKDVMKSWQTYSNAEITPEELRKQMAKQADEHLKKYVSNESVIKNAEKRASDNFDDMSSAFFDNARSGRTTTSQDIADGYVLAREYINKDEWGKAMDVYSQLASMQSEVGRALQSQRIFTRLTPEGRVTSTLNNIEKLRKESGIDLNVKDEWIEAIYNAKNNKELLEANRVLSKELWDQIPVKFMEKANAWRYLSMLGNPKTHIRNFLGNTLFIPARTISDGIATGLEKAFSKRIKSLGGDTGTHAIVNPFSEKAKSYRTVAKKQFEEVRTAVELGDTKYFNRVRSKDSRIFKTSLLDKAEKGNSWLLEGSDILAMKYNFEDAFTQFFSAKNIDINKVSKETLDKATEYAYEEALKATYRDANMLADVFNNLRKKARVTSEDKGLKKLGKSAAGGLMDAVAPFVKTPLNILKRGSVEYSPIGIARGIGTIASTYGKKGDAKSAEDLLKGIEYLSNGLTGTGILTLGYFLGGRGIVNGTLGDWNDKVSYDKMLGKQDYSITIGDNSYTLDWVAPMSMPFFVGVEAGTQFYKNGLRPETIWTAIDALSNMTGPIFELSMLQGVENVFNTAFAENNGISEIGKNALFNYASQYVPTLLGQYSRTITKDRQVALSTADHPLQKYVEKQLGNIANKVPRLSEAVNQDYVDQWGRTDSKLTGKDYRDSALENFIYPFYASDNKVTDVDEEITRLYESLGEEYKNEVIPKFSPTAYRQTLDDKEYIMTPEEFTQYKKTVGQAKFNGLEELFKTNKYKDASDDEKRKMIKQVYEDATAKGKDEYLKKVDKDYASAPEFYNIDKSTRDKYYTESLGISKENWGKAWHAKHDLSKAKEEETGKGTNAEEERIILLDNGIRTYEQAQSLLGKDTSEEGWEYALEQHKQGVSYEILQKEAKTCPNFYSLDVSQKKKWSKDLGVDKEVWGKAYQTYLDENKKKKEETGSGLNSEEAMILLKENGINTLKQARTINGNIGKTFLIFDNDSESAWDEMVESAKNGRTFEDASKEGYASAIKRNQAKEHVINLDIPEKHQSKATTIMTKYDGETVGQDVYDLYVRQVFYNNDNNPDTTKRNNTLDTKEIKSAIEKMDKRFGLTQSQKAYLFANTAPSNYNNPYD